MPQPRAASPQAPFLAGGQPGKFFPRDIFDKLVGLDAIRELYARAAMRDDASFFERVLSELKITVDVNAADVERIPAKGPLVVCANHPFGILDGMVLGTLLMQVRTDVRILTNLLLAGIPELQSLCFWVDPFNSGSAPGENRRAVRRALYWLEQGGAIATFPAGEVAHWRFRDNAVSDGNWAGTPVRMARMTGATILPVHFDGHNSVVFQSIGYVHPQLRTVRLPAELLNKRGNTVRVRIGNPIRMTELAHLESPEDAASHVRSRSAILNARWHKSRAHAIPVLDPITAPIPRELVRAEIDILAARNTLVETGEFLVLSAQAQEIPATLQEIGRQREIAFRAEGEGTGKALDLDRYDRHYTHLLLWSRQNRELAGAYRMGSTSQILPEHGHAGLYTSELFRYSNRFFQSMGPAVEVGRSFVRKEYQKQFAPLMLLWKGIGKYVELRPHAPVLFGAVSISSDYCRVSRELIVRHFERCKPGMSSFVTPKNPVKLPLADPFRTHALAATLPDPRSLSRVLADIEYDGKGLPILLTQYLKMGGKVLGFNVDREFSNVIDALIYVDLREAGRSALSRYMSGEGIGKLSAMPSCVSREIL